MTALFQLIKNTSKESPKNIISAYKDNAAIVEGVNTKRLSVNDDESYEFIQEKINSTIKVETHNHPTAISPFPGASTGSGGEIRDEGATGMGAKPSPVANAGTGQANPWKTGNLTQQMLLSEQDPQLAAVLKQEAQNK